MYNNIIKSVFIVLKNILLYGGGGGGSARAQFNNNILCGIFLFLSFFLSRAHVIDAQWGLMYIIL